jgi:hypothetical protein
MIGFRSLYIYSGLVIVLIVIALSNNFAKDLDSREDMVERGKLITEIYGCVDCHTPKIKEGEFLVNDPDRLFSGHPADNTLPQFPPEIIGTDKWRGLFTDSMTAWGGPWGISYSANLTPDMETGIGKLSEKDFLNVLNLGIHSDMNRKLMQPMPWKEISQLDEKNLKAVYHYLKSVKPVKNKVPESVPLFNHENLAHKQDS